MRNPYRSLAIEQCPVLPETARTVQNSYKKTSNLFRKDNGRNLPFLVCKPVEVRGEKIDLLTNKDWNHIF